MIRDKLFLETSLFCPFLGQRQMAFVLWLLTDNQQVSIVRFFGKENE